ncbi:hypothetical protein KFL_008860010 [Klebsormidium nitens]|uniref:Uncharacterized protein n=1 Tax=Klebsormidium nitens TaxID=105231 RepID=A0A1Y1IM16_KLENI|nr:hypothetical protein KFL_008860010 [Klebsormidium nitens]|eukprot:GAQ91935.1 hypothetical protein KFL_008860010 [Klebsormidium nitens]
MEEEKAAALYESLSRQGLGAARFKQGLGFGGGGGFDAGGPDSPAAPIAFKKAGADFSSEIENAEKQRNEDDAVWSAKRNAHESARVVRSIADKLSGRRSRRDDGERKRGHDSDSEEERGVKRSIRRGRSPDSEGEDHRRRQDSASPRIFRSSPEGPVERKHESRRERSPSHGGSDEEDRARERRIAERRKKERKEEGKSGRSGADKRESDRGSHREGRSEDRQRRGEERPQRVDTRRRSRSRSRERERRGVSNRGSDGRRDRREDERRNERSDRERRREEPLERSSDRDHRRHAERSSRRERSPGRGRDAARQAVKVKAKDDVIDYAEVIRGYENMGAAEKLKARTKYALSQTVRKDSAKGVSTEWERFDFDAAAPLDEDARQDMYGDDTKAGDDAAHLLNTGSTFGIAKAQAVREAEKQAAHDAAIFGLPVDRSGDPAVPSTKMPEKAPVFVPGDSEEDEEDRPVIVEEEPQAEAQQPETKAEAPVKAAVPSWKERALKAQQARKQAAEAAEAAAPS